MSLGVACLGAGYFARFHHEAWQRCTGAELLGIADLDQDRARDAAGPDVSSFGALPAMLEAVRPDILDIITPPATHAAAIRAALQAGVRAIICQKPFCTSLAEAETLAKEAERAGIPLVIHENFRFQPWFREAAKALDSGILGQLHQVTFRLRTGDGQGPKAYLDRQPYFQKMPRLFVHETGVHYVDTFRYLLGPIRAVYADLRRMNPVIAGEDAALVVFDFDNGVRATLDANRHLDHASDNTRRTFGEALIEGSDGTLELDGSGTLSHRRFGEQARHTLLAAQPWPGFAGDCVFALQSHVVAAMNGQREFENLASDYVVVRRVEEAIYASDAQGAKVRL